MGWRKILRGWEPGPGRLATTADLRYRRMGKVAVVLAQRRRPPQELWDRVVLSLEDQVMVACAAGHLLAQCGPSVLDGHADRLAAFLRHHRSTDAYSFELVDHVLAALAGLDDRRALPLLTARVADPSRSLLRPAYAPTLARLPELLPSVLTRMRAAPGDHYIESSLALLGQWGARAGAAVPLLAPLLGGPYARVACEVLGRIGPAGAATADVLADLARARTRPARQGWPDTANPWHGRQSAAWAHWRVTGDPGTALEVCGSFARAGLGGPVLRYLGDLGPAAAAHVDDVRTLLDAPGAWTRVEAASAFWRITGDPEPAVAVLRRELAPLRDARLTEAAGAAVRHLGAIGAPAAAAAALLREALADDRRVDQGMLADERLCRSLETALDAIEGNI
ncbi:hypothetical protein ACFWAR_29220 [Streptomyces sp. NPDC059917]|uniref:hypothetical protein n=1 Tax=Streptomyces sp. NPDC059917 TaxID=3347002 RepID=UPI003669FCCD